MSPRTMRPVISWRQRPPFSQTRETASSRHLGRCPHCSVYKFLKFPSSAGHLPSTIFHFHSLEFHGLGGAQALIPFSRSLLTGGF